MDVINLEKICKICGSKFETINLGGSRKYCFNCSPCYNRKNNHERALAITTIRRAIKKQLVLYKGGKCEKCGYDKCMNALQFHHTDPSKKDFNISQYTCSNRLDLDKVYKEIDKCILLCANCHAEEHEKNEHNKKQEL